METKLTLRQQYEKETLEPTQVMDATIGKPHYYGEYVEWLEAKYENSVSESEKLRTGIKSIGGKLLCAGSHGLRFDDIGGYIKDLLTQKLLY